MSSPESLVNKDQFIYQGLAKNCGVESNLKIKSRPILEQERRKKDLKIEDSKMFEF